MGVEILFRALLFFFFISFGLYVVGYLIYKVVHRWGTPPIQAGQRVEDRHYHDWLQFWKKVK